MCINLAFAFRTEEFFDIHYNPTGPFHNKERGIYMRSMVVSFSGLKNVAYTRVTKHSHIIRLFKAPVPLNG